MMGKGLVATLAMIATITVGSAVEKGGLADDRLTYARAYEAVIWAVPFLNTLQMRKELVRLGIGEGKLALIGSPPGPNLIIPTFNNQTAYLFGSMSLADGPLVMEIPAETDKAKLFGTFMNVWDDPIADVGPAGLDKGAGGRYVLLPPDYDGTIPEGMFEVRSNTFDVHVWFRSVAAADDADQAWIDAGAYARELKLYPLGSEPAPIEVVDVTKIDGVLEGNIMAQHDVFGLIDEYVQEEPVLPENASLHGMLKQLGFEKGKPFEPSPEMAAILEEAVKNAFKDMEDYLASGKAYVPFWDDRRWGAFRITPDVMASGATWNFETGRDYHARTFDFAFWAVGIPAAFDNSGGSSTFYLMTSTDENGAAMDPTKTYRLTVPADVPAADFWSILMYSTRTRTFADSPVFGLSSRDDLVVNDDGSVDLYVGPKAPEGFENNLLMTNPDDGTFFAFRFYGPLPPLTGGSWKLNDPVLMD